MNSVSLAREWVKYQIVTTIRKLFNTRYFSIFVRGQESLGVTFAENKGFGMILGHGRKDGRT